MRRFSDNHDRLSEPQVGGAVIPSMRLANRRRRRCDSQILGRISRTIHSSLIAQRFTVSFTTIILCAFLVVSLPKTGGAQFYFGQNKVQFTEFDWRVMTTEHFKIYYYVEEEALAKIAARSAEDSYLSLSQKFNHEIFAPIPLIIYSSPLYFSQTNTTGGMISESTGGFTEFLKGRMVLPFTGSYADFDHVIRHELVHVFTLSKLARIQRDQRTLKSTLPPLWFVEGLAEHWSTEWDSQGDMLVRDMVISGQILGIEDFWRVRGSFLMYKFGQSVCEFIESEYGSEKLTMIFENWWKYEKFSEVVQLTLGESLKEVSRKWTYQLKKKYYPLISGGDLLTASAQQLTSQGYAAKCAPILYDDGDGEREWIIYKADKLGYSSLYMMDGSGEKQESYTLLRGERSADYESMHLLRSGIDANNQGKIVFSSKSKETDALYIYDIATRSSERQLRLDGLVSMQSPRFSPDGSQVVFTAEGKSGVSDLYIVDLKSETFSRLTNDIYQDIDPAFTPDGEVVLFSSDRGPWGDRGAKDIYAINLSSGELKALTTNKYVDRAPEPSEDGFYFTSDHDGANNVYFSDGENSFSQVTHTLTGVFDPRLSANSDELVYTGYQNFQFQIFRSGVEDSVQSVPSEELLVSEVAGSDWRPGVLASESIQSSVKYDSDYSIDVAQSAVTYDPVFGSIGGIQLMMSDMLGDHTYYGFLSNSARSKSEILSSFNAGVSYFNLKRQVNWGVGAFHFYDEYYNAYDGNFFERQVGVYGQLRYPFSRYNRVGATTYMRWRDKDKFLTGGRQRSFLVSQFLSFVSDNSLWEPTGPLDGHRLNLTVGATYAVDESRVNDWVALADLRQYQRLGRHSAFATRLFAYRSGGFDPRRIYHGGSWSFRGYSRREWYVPKILFISNELRFPLINRLLVGLPIGNLGFSSIRGAIFHDAGSAWEDEFDKFVGSVGAGFRVGLGRVVAFRFDWSKRHDFKTIAPRTYFDFFFGWNF